MELQSKYNCKIIHISGASGSGKTTIGKNLASMTNLTVVDTDDITDHINDINLIYGEVKKILHLNDDKSTIIFVGHTIDLTFLANAKYWLDTDPRTIYERLVGRTINDICDNKGKIENSIADHSISTREGYDKLANEIKIRFPGMIPPDMHINNDINQMLERGYIPMSADKIIESVAQLI